MSKLYLIQAPTNRYEARYYAGENRNGTAQLGTRRQAVPLIMADTYPVVIDLIEEYPNTEFVLVSLED